MNPHRYQPGDRIVLRKGPMRHAIGASDGEVLATLPESGGSLRYRVRISTENFDRSIPEEEIESVARPDRYKQAQNRLFERR